MHIETTFELGVSRPLQPDPPHPNPPLSSPSQTGAINYIKPAEESTTWSAETTSDLLFWLRSNIQFKPYREILIVVRFLENCFYLDEWCQICCQLNLPRQQSPYLTDTVMLTIIFLNRKFIRPTWGTCVITKKNSRKLAISMELVCVSFFLLRVYRESHVSTYWTISALKWVNASCVFQIVCHFQRKSCSESSWFFVVVGLRMSTNNVKVRSLLQSDRGQMNVMSAKCPFVTFDFCRMNFEEPPLPKSLPVS